MQITTEQQDQFSIVRMTGDLDTGTVEEAEAHFEALRAEGSTKIAMDLAGLDYVSSAGLRVLLVLAQQLETSGGELRLFALNEMVSEVFDISGFSAIIATFPDEQAALTGF